MKVLLITPPSDHIIRQSLPPVVEDETGEFPPLGLLYIAAYVEQIPDCEVQVIDCAAEKVGYESLAEIIKREQPDVVGIQAMTFTLIDASHAAEIVRKEAPSAYIVFGGPHPTIYPKETALIPHVDAAIAGEGEFIFSQLVLAIKDGRPPEEIAGVYTKKRNSVQELSYIQDLDQLLMPARHLVNAENYFSPLAKKRRITTIMSSRGCPAKCLFCDRPQMGKKFRKLSAERVVHEMIWCHKNQGIEEFVFYDDTFTIDKKRVIDICDLLSSSGLELLWDIRARVDTVSPEMIKKLRKAGCCRIHYGVESGSPVVQKILRKNLDLERVKSVFALTKKAGIEVLGYFMIGCPGETREELEKTFNLISTLPMDYVHVTIFTPYPATAAYANMLSSGEYTNDFWLAFAKNPTETFTPRYCNQFFSDEELHVLLKQAYRSFYGRPSYILRSTLKVRSMNEFIKKASMGIKLLKSIYS